MIRVAGSHEAARGAVLVCWDIVPSPFGQWPVDRPFTPCIERRDADSTRRSKIFSGTSFLGDLGVLEVKEGTLYPLLHRLEDAGQIAATWEVEGRARPRKYYEITPAGPSHLAVLRAEWTGLVQAMRNLLDALDEVGK